MRRITPNSPKVQPATQADLWTRLPIRLIPDISKAAFRNRQATLISDWYVLRTITRSMGGSGIIDKALLMDVLVDYYGSADRTVYAHLQQGNGKFWDIVQTRWGDEVMLYKVERVAAILGIERWTSHHFSEIPASEFRTPRQRKAKLFESCHQPTLIGANITRCGTDGVKLSRTVREPNPISRAALTQSTGLARSTQLRLERAAGVKSVPQWSVEQGKDGTIPVKVIVKGKNKVYEIDKQLPSVYLTQQRQGAPGVLSKLTNKARYSKTGGAESFIRRYFTSGRKLIKALGKGHRGNEEDGAYLRVLPPDSCIPGRAEWVWIPA